MNIKKIHITQFAGLSMIKDITMTDGLNIMCENNGTGKSTVVDFIFQMLFMPVTLDKRRHTDFISRCFPSEKKDGTLPTMIKGELVFEDDSKIYTLNKTWNLDEKGVVELIRPDGSNISGQEKVDAELKSILKYGEGTYKETVFFSQRDKDRFITGELFKDKSTLSVEEMLKNSLLETGGVTIEQIGDVIKEKNEEYWKPKYKDKDTNNINRCRAELESLEEELDKTKRSEDELNDVNDRIDRKRKELSRIKDELMLLDQNEELLETKRRYQAEIDSIKADLNEKERDLTKWPVYEEEIGKAKIIKQEIDDAAVVEEYKRVLDLRNKYLTCEKELNEAAKVNDEDIRLLEQNRKLRDKALADLGGVHSAVEVKTLGDVEVSCYPEGDVGSIKKLNNGESVDIDRTTVIRVDEVIELVISNAGVDVPAIKHELLSLDRQYDDKCAEYKVARLEDIKRLKDAYEDLERAFEKAKATYVTSLNGRSWERIEGAYRTVPETSRDLTREYAVMHLNRELNIDEKALPNYIAERSNAIRFFTDNYGDIDSLKDLIAQLKNKKADLEKKAEAVVIPEGIEGLDKELLEEQRGAVTEELEVTLKEEQVSALASVKNNARPLAQIREDIAGKTAELDQKTREGQMWARIKKEFDETREELDKIDVSSLKEYFEAYMHQILEDRIEFSDLSDDMQLHVYTGRENALKDDILSSGNREAIEFAFRLALLRVQYPDGNGFAIFDDPFVNMDPSCRENACKVLTSFASDNQVLFVTADPIYLSLLEDANTLEFLREGET